MMDMVAGYDYRLVFLSVAISMCASYTAFDLTSRIRATERKSRASWLLGGASALGLGIWSMHYLGMLALHLPVEVHYDLLLVLASLAAAILASGVVLVSVSKGLESGSRK